MRLRRYTFEEIYAASDEELQAMIANNGRVLQWLDFGCVLGGSWVALIVLDLLQL